MGGRIGHWGWGLADRAKFLLVSELGKGTEKSTKYLEPAEREKGEHPG